MQKINSNRTFEKNTKLTFSKEYSTKEFHYFCFIKEE